MKVISRVFVLIVIAFTIPGHSQSPKPVQAKTPAVSASGCTEAGVEAGCVVLKDSRDGTEYNLFFPAGSKPNENVAIWFKGVRHDGPTICMQGIAIDVQKWKRLRMKCPGDVRRQRK